MRSKRVGFAVLSLVTVAVAGWRVREESFEMKAARMVAAVEAHRAAGLLVTAEEPLPSIAEKAVPRTDKNTFTFIGNVYDWATDSLSDGTPLTLVVMRANKPFAQDVYVSCIGNNAFVCEGTGRRQFDGYLLSGDGDSFDEFLFLAIATKVKK